MARLPVFCLVLLLVTPAAFAAPVERTRCTLRARRLVLGRRGGELRAGCLLDPQGRTLLRAESLRWAKGRLSGRGVRTALCACDGEPSLSLSARQAWVAEEGLRLHLTWPVLRLGPVPILAAPYVALPLSPGVSGLLPPELSYSPRDGLRLAQGVYLATSHADAAVHAGWVQQRGVAGSSVLRYAFDQGDGELELRGLRDGQRWRGSIMGRLLWRGEQGALGARLALVGDPLFLRDLHRDPRWFFAPFVRSRIWGSAGLGPLLLTGHFDVYQPTGAPLPTSTSASERWRGAAAIDLLPQPWGPLVLLGSAGAEVLDPLASSLLGVDPGGGAALAFWLAPRLSLARRLGPLSLVLGLAYHLRALGLGLVEQAPDVGARWLGEQALLASLEAGLPLFRRFGRWEHRLAPYVATTVFAGEAWRAAAFDQQPLASLSLIEAGLRSTLATRGLAARSRGELALRALYEPTDRRPLLGADFRLALGLQLELSLRVLADLLDRRLAWLETRACGGSGRLRLCAGYRRQQAERLWPLFVDAALVILGAPPMATPLGSARVDQVEASAQLRVGPIVFEAGGYLDPQRKELTHARYGVRWSSRCRCLELGLWGRSFVGQAAPDVAVLLSLRPSALGACLAQMPR